MILSALLSASLALAAPVDNVPHVIAPVSTNMPPKNLGSNDIHYNMGAPVLTDDVNVYLIYYGNYTTKQKSIIETFIKELDQSSWWNMTRKYYSQKSASSPKVYVKGGLKLAGTVQDNYSLGKKLSGNALPNIIQAQIDSKALREDTSAIYYVLTAADVQESIRPELGKAAFCQQYCGYHVSWELKSGKRIYYAQSGNPTPCLSGCAPRQNQRISPNGDVGIDAMLSVIAHELTEAVTDPESDGQRAWEDNSGYENADKCGYTYGAVTSTANGTYNVVINQNKYLIQQNWNPEKQACSLV